MSDLKYLFQTLFVQVYSVLMLNTLHLVELIQMCRLNVCEQYLAYFSLFWSKGAQHYLPSTQHPNLNKLL